VGCPPNSPPWSFPRTQALAWHSIGEILVEVTFVARPTLHVLPLLTYRASYSQWPHVTGPLITYMASCDTTTCDKFNGSTAKWFKIDQIGKKSDGDTWYQQDVGAW
jgi:hypothetical protein